MIRLLAERASALWGRRPWIQRLGLVLLLLLPALWNLGGGELQEWDEGLALRHARNALEFGKWLTPTNQSGGFSPAFTKPPLLLWETALSLLTFGWSPFGARAGTALSLVLTAWLAAELAGELKASKWLGPLWALAIVCCQGALDWSRKINIEITLVAFSMGALLCYARAMREAELGAERRSRLWALAAGIALCGAFLTKQLVVALPALAIVGAELFALRKDVWKAAMLRLSLAGVPALVVALGWTFLAHQASRGRLVRSMVEFTIVRRVSGFSSGQHHNHLNRLAMHLESSLDPFPWELAMIGFGFLWYRLRRERPPALVLLTLYVLIGCVLFDGGTRSLLPWYAWSVAVPLLLGLAHLMSRLVADLRGLIGYVFGGPASGNLSLSPEAALGAAAVMMATSRLWELQGSRVVYLILTLGLMLIAGAFWSFRRNVLSRALVVGAVVGWPTLAFAYALSQRPEYSTDPGRLFSLMAPTVASKRTAVDASFASKRQRNIYQAAFGPHAVIVSREPWKDRNRGRFQAYVQPLQLPMEFSPPKGVKLHRSQAAVAWVGKLETAPFDEATFGRLLAAGPLTFRAEFGSSELQQTFTSSQGQTVRSARRVNVNRYKAKPKRLVEILTPRLPAGNYQVSVKVDAVCDKRRRGPVGELKYTLGRSTQMQTIDCTKSGWRVMRQRLQGNEPAPLKVEVRVRAGDLSVDSVVIERSTR